MKRLLLVAMILLSAASAVSSQQSTITLFYVATAVDASGTESAFSNQATAVVSPAHNVVNLSWTASTSTVAGYNMYRSKVSGGSYSKLNSALITGTTYSDTFPFPTPPTGLTESVP